MCYSAQIVADYKKFARVFGATVDLRAFAQLWINPDNVSIKLPKAMGAAFAHPASDGEAEIKALIDASTAVQKARFEPELFSKRTRLVKAERKLAAKVTEAASESQPIATSKVDWVQGKLEDLWRTESLDRNSRIFSGYYVPVMVMEGGQRIVKPIRYKCRPNDKPAFYDVKFPGTYNARRYSLERFWRGQFGHTHGVMIATAFYEHVPRQRAENQNLEAGEVEEDRVLQFRPRPKQEMLVACIWSHWTAPGQPELLSFAAITDDPPPDVAAAGHDRCILPIKPTNVDAWLNPDPANLTAQ